MDISTLRELKKKLLSETKRESSMPQEEPNFKLFARELAKLSKKYGVAIQSVGGVSFGKITNIVYSDDPTSGDLSPRITWGKEAAMNPRTAFEQALERQKSASSNMFEELKKAKEIIDNEIQRLEDLKDKSALDKEKIEVLELIYGKLLRAITIYSKREK